MRKKFDCADKNKMTRPNANDLAKFEDELIATSPERRYNTLHKVYEDEKYKEWLERQWHLYNSDNARRRIER